MSFAGTVLDMISRSKYNRGQLVERHEKIKKLRDLHTDSNPYKSIQIHEKKVSSEQSEIIKSGILRKIRHDNIRNTVLTFLSLLFVCVLIYMAINFISKIN